MFLSVCQVHSLVEPKNGYTDQGEAKSYRKTVYYSNQRLTALEWAGVPETGMPISSGKKLVFNTFISTWEGDAGMFVLMDSASKILCTAQPGGDLCKIQLPQSMTDDIFVLVWLPWYSCPGMGKLFSVLFLLGLPRNF